MNSEHIKRSNQAGWDDMADSYQATTVISLDDVHYGPLSPGERELGLLGDVGGKRVLELAGVSDILSRSKGQTRTTINYSQATYNALANLNKMRISDEQKERLFMAEGRLLE